MKRIIGAIAVGALIFVGGAGSADAADLYGGRYGGMKDYGAMPPAMNPATWYVRGDFGYSGHDVPTIAELDIFGTTHLSDAHIARTASWGGGVGMYFGRNVRGDFTVDYRRGAEVHGADWTNGDPSLRGIRRFDLQSTVLLGNVYYDFNYFGDRFTPYLGVGLGAVRHKSKDGTIENCGCTTATITANEQWHVAAAFMAGTSVKITERMKLDAGYRFLYLGQFETGPITMTGGGGIEDPTVDGIRAHEFRVGVRWDIN